MSAITSTIQQLVSQLSSSDQVQAFQARRTLNDEIARLTDPREAARLSDLADVLVAELNDTVELSGPQPRMTNVLDDLPSTTVPKHSAIVRRLLCQLLSPIATDAQVPGLVAALADLEVREAARGVLDQIPTLLSTNQLIKAFAQVGPEFRVSVLNSLGKQHWREAMVTLACAAKDPDLEIRVAALEGLAHFPESEHDKLFVEATQLDLPRHRARAQKARVRFAETLRLAGESEAARAIYQSIESTPADGPWKKAARIGLASMHA
jgi:hypothetical protein